MNDRSMNASNAHASSEPFGADAQDFPALVRAVRRNVDERLDAWLRPRVAQASAVSEEVGLVAESVLELTMRGGKRLRAALVVVGYAAGAGSREAPSAVELLRRCEPAMFAIELLQTYLLIHDDWMDDDDTRRGAPSVHVHLREKLGARALGDAAAILAGDLASAFAQQALFDSTASPERVLDAARVFARTQVDVVTGQVAEMRAPARRGPLPSVETIHALKTASYTVTGPLLLGAALAGAEPAVRTELEKLGLLLGVAFQLRDDLLGVFGDPAVTGKPIGNDVRQGKRTSLVSDLLRDPSQELVLAHAFGKVDATDEAVEAVVRAMESSGARERAEARVRELCDEARQILARTSLSEQARIWLDGAVLALGERSS